MRSAAAACLEQLNRTLTSSLAVVAVFRERRSSKTVMSKVLSIAVVRPQRRWNPVKQGRQKLFE